MPVYNEEGAIAAVLAKWVKELDTLNINYQIHTYNDGSKDNTAAILESEAKKYPGRIFVHDKANSGHGPTILQGYREQSAVAEWVFQMDSDDEMGPEKFGDLWEQRDHYDFLIGIRDGRYQQLPRKIISWMSRAVVRIFFGRGVRDVNSPYRLMKSDVFSSFYWVIPDDTFAPNVIISGWVAREHLKFYECQIPHGDRKTGEVSIKKWKLLKVALKSFVQTIKFGLLQPKKS
jgi:glycosyltransferase involved in cell wall biosynthesis